MLLQVEETIYQNKEVTPYPEFIKQQIRKGRLELNQAREHTRDYLCSYNKGNPHPPTHYYQKVAAKDKLESMFSPQQLQEFQTLLNS